MFALLYRTVAVAVWGAAHSLHYAAPFMAGIAAVAALYLRGGIVSPFVAALLAVAVLLALGMPYVIVVLHAMLRGEAPPFTRVLRWRRRDADFFVFVAASFVFGGILTALVANIGITLQEHAAILEQDATPGEKYGYGDGAVLVVLSGSRAFAAAFFLVSILLWVHFFRTAIRIPAYADGYDLRADEALTLTRHGRLLILSVSLFMNIGLSSAAFLSPWRDSELWLQALMAGFAAWSFLHANLALSVALYLKYTEGYRMRPLRVF